MISILALYFVSTAQLTYSSFGTSRHATQCADMIQSSFFRMSRSSPHCVHRAGFLLSGFTVTTRPNFGVQHRRMYRINATLDGSESNDDPKALNELNERLETQKEVCDQNTQQLGELKQQLNKLSEDFNEFKLSSVRLNYAENSRVDSLFSDLSSTMDTNSGTLISKIDSLSIDLKSEIAALNDSLGSRIASSTADLNTKIISSTADLNKKTVFKSANLNSAPASTKKIDGLDSRLTAMETARNVVMGILYVYMVFALAKVFSAVIPWTTFSWWPWKN